MKTAIVALLSLLPNLPAAAQTATTGREPAEDVAAPRVLSAWLDLGLGAPTGYLGGHLEARLLPELALGAHAGTGESGTQLGASIRSYCSDPEVR